MTALGRTGFSPASISLQALSPTVCRPFDAQREDWRSAKARPALLTLETLESARRRGAEILGELIGYGTSIDQHHRLPSRIPQKTAPL